MSYRTTARIMFGLIVSVCLVFGSTASGAIVTQYSFENDLLDTASGGLTADNLTGYAASGTLATSYQPGIVGQAVRVSRDAGEATVLQAADSNDLDLSANWTLEAFVHPDTANTNEWDRFATKWFDTTGEWHWSFRYGNNGQDLFVNGAQAINAGGARTVPIDRWSHVAMTGDSTDAAAGIKLWQNGMVVGTAAYQAVTARTNAFRIGNRNAGAGEAGSQFSGLVDEFTMHDEAKDAAYMRQRVVQVAAIGPQSGLVNYYQLEDTGNDTASQFGESASTIDDHLTLVGNASYAAGQVGQAIDLDGGYFTAPHSADVELPSSFTIEAWINPDSPGDTWNRLLLNWGTSETSYHFALHSGEVSLYIEEANGDVFEVAVGGTVAASEWQHVAAVLDDSTGIGTVYLDGLEVGNGLFDSTLFTTTAEGLGLGDSVSGPHAGNRYTGLIDEMAIWNVALTPVQITSHYLAGAEGYGLSVSEPVPEPGTFLLAILGCLGIVPLLRRRKKVASEW